ncbi:hypothetical protein [Blastococcus sp. SYSU DS0539]
MPAREDCTSSDHRAPADGGSCACGMVTRIPAARTVQPVDVRDVLARCLDDGAPGLRVAGAPSPDDAVGSPGLRQRVDRVLAALADAGLVVARDDRLRPPA